MMVSKETGLSWSLARPHIAFIRRAILTPEPGSAFKSDPLKCGLRRVVAIDIAKNSSHIVGLDDRRAFVLRPKWSRGQVEARFANMPPCLICMEACLAAHHLNCKLSAFGHDAA